MLRQRSMTSRPGIKFGRSASCSRLQPQDDRREQSQSPRYAPQDSPFPRHPDRPLEEAVREISAELNAILADSFALYLKTKNFHWHVSGPHFRDYHLLLDEQGGADFRDHRRHRRARAQDRRHHAALDRPDQQAAAASRTTTPTSSPPREMLRELMNDNKSVAASMREAHEVAEKHEDVATPACSRTSSTRPRGAPGSCSRRARPRQRGDSVRCRRRVIAAVAAPSGVW